ncbi:MAG: putative maltokinase, partial [Acidobacteriota bacterium]
YYGDEIGMGDNIYLGDRNGVRTPMQWNGDRNAGFSRATPGRLFSPVIMDPVYGYETINVEAQQADPSSLLHWMRNMIALRKLFRVFGRGSMEFLSTGNRKVLAYLRRYDNEVILCVANLSRFAQPAELDLAAFAGSRPVEMLGYVEFPVIGRRPYSLTPGPYAFMWFEVQALADPVEVRLDDDVLSADDGWAGLFSGLQGERFEAEVLPRFLPKQRWFGGKARRIQKASVRDWTEFNTKQSALILLDIEYASGPADTYFVPLVMSYETPPDVPEQAVLCALSAGGRPGIVYDASFHEGTRAALLAVVEGQQSLRTQRGAIHGSQTTAFAVTRGPVETPLPAVRPGSEQSNTSLVYGDRLILKLFRRQQFGTNPDVELTRYLTEQVPYPHIAAVAGTIDYTPDAGEPSTLALVQALVPNQGDAWRWTLEVLERYYQDCSLLPPIEPPAQGVVDFVALSDAPLDPEVRDRMGLYVDAVARLGRRTAELHVALATPSPDAAFAPVPMSDADANRLALDLHENAVRVLDGLKDAMAVLPDAIVESAGLLLSRRRQWLDSLQRIAAGSPGGLRTRIHGDFHLGQVLRVKNDYTFLDFEGEPSRPIAARRVKYSPLKDVAGMLRSFSYAAWLSLQQFVSRGPDAFARLAPWATQWEQAAAAAFLRAYRDTPGVDAFLPPDAGGLRTVLDAYVLDKALYEVLYELNNRPAWVWIPLQYVLTRKV